jgi:asparagine synthase (glutamine-hydrolysing)
MGSPSAGSRLDARPVVRAEPGPPLGTDASRHRPCGRIGGLVGHHDPAVVAALARVLGPGAGVMSMDAEAGALVADWDACWLDGQPVTGLPQWRHLLDADRLGEVDGAFALAWRGPDGGFHLARDAIGERTLYYARVGDGVAFASTVPALLATGLVPRTLDLAAVAAYLVYAYVPGAATLLASVRELLPGEVLSVRDGRLAGRRYFTLPPEPHWDATPPDEDTLRSALRDRLETAVRRRLPVGEPVGAFLSGGIDSSLVVALARRASDKPVVTYSVSFGPDHPNELAWSSLVAAHCAAEHRVVELGPAVVHRHLDEAVALLGKPIGDPLTVPNALLFREAAADVGVVLNGEGGDPCFGGPKNAPMLLAEWLGDGANDTPGDPWTRERSYLRAHQKCYDDLPAMLTDEVAAALAAAPLEAAVTPYFTDPRWRSFVTRLMAVNVAFKGAHHILPKVDALSAPFGVLPRSPLFARPIVETAFAIPPQWKLRGAVEKYLLKEAVRDLLPAGVVDRPKSGMLVPVEGWFAPRRGPLHAHARERLLDGLAGLRLVRRPWLERLLAGRLGGLRPRHGAKIWLLLTLEAWLRSVAGRR